MKLRANEKHTPAAVGEGPLGEGDGVRGLSLTGDMSSARG